MTRAKTNKKSAKLHKRVHRHIKLAVVPHKANQYRPHLIRTYGIVVILVLVLTFQFVYNWSKTGSVLGVKANVTALELLDDTNRARKEGGVAPLNYNEQLSAAAFLKAQDMLKQQYWAHVAPDGTTPWQWFAKVDYNYSYAGENLAKNFTSADATTTAWMASPKHRENILNTHYTEVGFAVVDGQLNGEKTTLIVALFARPADRASVAGTTTPNVATTPMEKGMSVITRLGVALQSITPAALGSIVLVAFAGIVALVAHAYRKKLPKTWQKSWRLHHGLIKATGMLSLCIMMLFLYSGGQI